MFRNNLKENQFTACDTMRGCMHRKNTSTPITYRQTDVKNNTLCASNNRMNFSFRATANLSPITLCIKIKQDSRAGPIPTKHLAFQLARLITAALIDVSTYINDGSNDCCYETGTAWSKEPTKKHHLTSYFSFYTRLQLLSDAQTGFAR